MRGWSIDFLNAHPVIENVSHDLDLAERLKMAACNAEWHHRLAVSCQQRRNNCVERSFAWRDRVRMAAREHETARTIVEDDALSAD